MLKPSSFLNCLILLQMISKKTIVYGWIVSVMSFLMYKVVFYEELVDYNILTTYYTQNQLCYSYFMDVYNMASSKSLSLLWFMIQKFEAVTTSN